MRKLTLLIVSLLCYVGVLHAQALVADGVYTLSADVNKQRGELVAANGYDYPVLEGIDLSGYTQNSTAAQTNGQYWYVQSVDASRNTYYIYNIARGKYLVNENGNVNFGDTPYVWTFVTNAGKPAYLNIKDASKTGDEVWLSSGCGRTASQRPVQWDNNNNDGGALYTFTRISDYFVTPETGKFYKIKGDGELPWLTANATNGGNVVVSKDDASAGVFLKTENGIQAVATGKYLGYSGGKYTYSDTELTIELRNTGDYLANYNNRYAVVSGGNYMFNNNNDGIVHESTQSLNLPRLWAFIEVETPAATVNGVLYETLEAAAAVVKPGQTLTLWKDSDATIELPMGVTLNKNNFEAAGVTVAQPVAKVGDVEYATLAAAIEAAQPGAEIVVIADVADVTVDVTKNLTISGSVTLNNVGINANGADALTVNGLTFTGNSWINSGTAEALTVSGVTATVAPSNTSYTNSRSAFISLGRSEGQELALTVENSNITVTAAGADAILGWAKITKATITGNVIKGSSNGYFANADAIKFMAIAPNAEFEIKDNEIYSNYNGIVFAQNTTRDNAYSVSADANKFYGGADHIWIEVSGANTVHATVNATSANTVNGNAFTVGDIKYRSAVIKNWTSYAGVDVVTDENGKVIGGTLASFSNAESVAEGYEIGTNGAVGKASVAEVNGTKYASLAEAAADAQAGDEIKLLADVTLAEALTLPAGITFNGNGKQITGTLVAAGDITFAGITKAGDLDFAVGNTVVNIPAGASLQLNGSARMSIGFGTTFNITGNITEAKTANVADLTPSLVIPGASFLGAGVKFNVTNAYISVPSSYCSTSKTASGTFDFNITNSIWESAGKLAFEEQSVNAKVDFALVNSVLTTGSHLVFGTASGEEGVVIDNSYVNKGTSRQLENCGTMTIKNGSVVNGAVATSSNAKNPGTVIVENATYAVTGEFSGSDLGTGTIIIKKDAKITAEKITKANITIDATGMTAGDEINLTANLSGLTGTLSVINNDKLEAKIVDGKVVLAAKPVAKIGEQGYATLQAAINAVQNGETIILTDNIAENVVIKEKDNVKVTIDGNGKTMTGTIKVEALSSDNDRRITIKNIKFVDTADANVDFISAGASNYYPRLTVEGCTFTGSANRGDVAVRLKDSQSVIISNCSGTSLHSFLQNTAGWNLTVEKVTVTDSKSGFALGTVQGVTIKECNISASDAGYGIRLDAQYNNNAVIESNTVKAFIPVVVRKATVDSNITVKGTNTMTATNTDGLWFAAGTSEYETNGTMPTAATGKVKVTLNDTGLSAAGVYGNYVPVAKIGDVEYTSLEAAFAAATEGQTIVMLDNATPALTSQRAITKAAVIDLGGKTLTLTEDDLYFGTTTFKNGTIVVDPSVKPSTAVFWMFANQTLTFDNVKIVATGVTGTYLIGLEGENSDLNLLNGSEILVENTTALDLDIICVNGTNTCDIKVENSKVNVTNLDGRVFFRGNYTVKDSEVNLAGITKAGFRIEAGQTLSIEGTSKVNIEGEPRDGGIHLTDVTAKYTKAADATVNATLNEPAKGSITVAYTSETSIWGEGGGNAKESLVIKVLDANDNVMGTSTLNNVGGIIDGDVYVTWSIMFNAPAPNPEAYWSMEWTTAPSVGNMPAKVAIWVDGVEVGRNNVVLNGPDDLNKIVAAVTDAEGKIISCQTSVAKAVDTGAKNIALLRETNEEITLPAGVELNKNGFTAAGVTVKTVAKVGNTEYSSIDKAIAAWTNNTTLTLLDNVTLSDVITLKSTEHHILNLGTYTMTAADGQNAIVIKACGTGDAERTAITINADAENPGGINAGSKCVVYYKYADGGISTNDRPIIKINGGVFTGATSTWGTAGIYTIGTAARKCATLNITGGTFNCSINGSGKSKLIISGGVFNYSVGSQGDSTALRLISGGTFKTFGFMTADSNNTKFWFGTSMGNSNVGVHVDDNGYIVVGGAVVTEAGDKFEASSTNYSGANSLLQYSSAKDNGLYYTSVEEALADNNKTTGEVTVYADEIDMTGISYKGTIIVPAGEKVTITGAPADLKVATTDGYFLENNNGIYESKVAVAQIGETIYTSLADALAAATEGATVTLLNDTEESIAAINNVKLATAVAGGVTVKNTYSDWINMTNVAIGTGVTLEMKNVYYTNAGVNVIEGTLNATTLYNANNSKTTVQNGGKIATTGMIVNRYHTAADAGIYVYGDGDASTVEVKCDDTIGTYSGTFYAKDAVVNGNMLWIDYLKGSTQEADNYSQSKPVFENSTVNITKELRLYKDATLTLVGANVTAGTVQVRENATPTVNVDANSTIKATTVQNLAGATLDAVLGENGIVSFKAFVAKVGNNRYYTLEDAFKAATSGCTIDILSDVTVDYNWDARYTGGKFTVPVTINGNGKTIKFTGSVNDNNWNTVFRFEENAAVNNLTVDISNATGAQRVISAKKSLAVDGLKIVGEARYGVIYGEGASAADLAATEIVVKNSTLGATRRALSDNEGGKDVKSVVIESNTFNANVYVSASESIAFNNNTVAGETDLRSYAADNVLDVQAQGNTLTAGKKNYIYAKTIEAQTEFATENPPLKVATKAELQAALAAAKEGDVVILTADIDYGTDQLAITKAITLDLGGKTLTTRNAFGGMSIKGNPTVKNGNIVHASNTAAIKVWNATAFEDLVIDVQGKGDANKTIGGIVLQSGSTTKVGSIKNVTIKGAALTNGIETYNCGDATENVIGAMENVTIDAQGTGLLISAPCGTATNCDIKGGVNAVEIFIKGNYSASLELVASTVEGGVYAHDEFSSNPDIVNNGTIKFTADEATTGAAAEDVTLEIARAESEKVQGVLNDVMVNAKAKLNNVYYATFAEALAAAKAGDTLTLLADLNMSEILVINKAITLNGNGKKLTSTAKRAINVDCEGNVAIKNLTINASGERAINVIEKPAKVTIDNVTATAANYTVNLAGSAANAVVAINNSNLTGLNVVNVAAAGAKVTVNGGTIVCNDQTDVESYAALVLNKDAKNGSIVATDVTFIIDGDSRKASNQAEGGIITIDGSADEVEQHVAYISYGNNWYGFATLEAAIAKANAGETVTLLSDVKASAIITIDKAITLDGNGKTLTSTAGRAINVSGADGVTIKNLTINASGERAINVIQNATNVTIDNVTATAANYTVNVAASAPNAKVAIKNSTLNGLCTVNVAAAGANVTVDNSTVNCNDNNTTAGESYAALSLNKDAVGGSIVATNSTINVTEGSDSEKGRNGAENGTVTINGSTDGVAVMVAVITYEGSVYYHSFSSLAKAVEFAKAGDVITLIRDVTISYGARDLLATAAADKAVTIDGNGNTLTLNQTNSDWASIGLENNNKLVLKNMTINKSGKGATSGAWNTHAIIFSCPVEMTDVTVNNSVAVQAGATLTNVTINEANGYYGLWINGNGQTVTVNGGAINATNGGRGIKIADQYIDAPAKVTLNVDGTVFNTAKKAAVLVSSEAGAKITAANVNIANVAEDKVNFVWVDEDWAQHFGNVEVTGATVRAEGVAAFTAAITANGAVQAYYKTLAEAVNAAEAGATVELLANVTLAGGYTDATEGLRIEKEITLNGNGHTIDCGTFQKGIRIYNLGNDGDFQVNFNNVEVVNNVANGRCIDTRSHDINLTITDSKLIAQNGNSQPLTIGGSEAVQRVKLDDAIIDAGNSGYGVIAFVPVKQNIYAYDNTTVTGYAAFYLKDHGNANIKLSLGKGTYIGKNIHSGASNTFGTVVLEGDNNVLQILGTNPTLKAITEGNASQAIVLVIGANNKVLLESESATIDIEGENAYYGMISAENAGTTTIINKGNTMLPVAEVGGFQFMTIKEAIRYAGNEGTVKAINDCVLAEAWTIPAGKKYTLDLNGKTVSYTSAVAGEDMITNRGNLTITDSSDAKTGKLAYVNTDNTASNVTVSTISTEAGSTLVVDGGTIENKTVKADGSSIYSYAIDILTNGNLGDVNVTINGGTVYSDYMAIRQFNNGTACKNSLTINGGYIYGAKRAVQVHMDNNAAVTAIKGGKVEAGEGGYAICNFAATGNLEVTGGEFIGAVYSARENFISGGIYDAEVYAGYCAEGYMPNKNVDGTYGVVAVKDVYAIIDGVTYGSLKAAVKAAKAGETITLLQNVKENVTISKNLTIDGAGKTITGMITTDGKSLKVTIKNVNFDGNNGTINYAMRADDDLNLVVEDCTASNYLYGFLYANKSNDKIVVKNVTVENCAEYGAYLVAFNSASFENFTVKGNTKYGIVVANAGARTVNLKNVTFEGAEQPLHINEIGTGKVTFNFSGSNEMSKAEFYTSQYVKVVAAAQVGTKVCGSLQDAVVAANDGETVKVLADVNMTTANFVTQVDGYATLVNVAGKAVTIDLNGKKVTVNAAKADLDGKAQSNMLMSVFHADPNGTLTLTDSSAEGTGTVELFANDATVYALIVSENANDKSNPGKIIVNGGNYIADRLTDSMIFADINEVITVNGGNFHLGNVGEGPKGNGSPWIFNASGNNQMHINVNGGTYNANVAKQHWTYEVKLGEGLTTTNNGDGTWTVVPAVATVGEESFGSIQEAIDAAQNGETVKLIADVALDTKKYTTQVDNLVVLFNVKGKAVTFDLNGKKIDVNASAANLGGKMLAGVFSADVEGDFTITDSSAEGTGAVNVAVNDAKVYSVFISENAGDKTKSGKMTVEAGNFTTIGKVANAMIFADTDKVVTINGGTFICDGVSASENYPWLINTTGNNTLQVVVNGGTFNIDINHQYRPFEVFVPENLAVKANGNGTWTIVPAQAYVTELLGNYVNEPGDNEHKVGYATVAEAIAATNDLGKTVTILAGDYTQNLNVNKAITVKGEVDAEGNNLVTFNGKLSITADGATVENLNFNNSGTAAYVGAKNVTIDGCSLVGSNGLYQSYTRGTVTFKNSYIKGGTYGIHFDGNAGGNIVIENCTVIGWTSFAGTIENVAISGTTFAEGNYNQLRFYQNATITECTFNEKMNIDWKSSGKAGEFNNCSVEGGKELIEILSLSNIVTNNLEVTIDGVPVCVAAKVDSKYYMSLQEAINAATVGQIVTILSDITLTEGVTVAADDEIFIDLNGKTVSMETAEAAVAALIKNNGTLTIESSVDGGKLSFLATAPSAVNAYASNTISNYGTLTINGGTVENLSTGGACYALDNYAGSTATINGGKLTAEKTAVRIFNWTNGEANAAELNVEGGEIISNDGYGININAGNAPYVALNISGGTITTNDTDYNLAVYVVNKNSAENFTANISGGTFNGNLALNGVTSTTMAKGNVSVSGGTFDGVICYGEPACQFITGGSYMTEFTEDYLVYGYQLEGDAAPYKVEWTGRREEVTFIDGKFTEYTNKSEIEVGKLRYERKFSTAWTPLYAPFEIPVSELAEQGLEVAYINGVRKSDYDENGVYDEGWSMELIMIHGGKGNADGSSKTLKANYPYFVRSKSGVVTMDITLEEATLYAAVEKSYDCTTFIEKYEITGNCSKMTSDEFEDNNYIVGAKGWSRITEGSYLNPFRFYMTVTSREDGSPVVSEASMSIVVRGEELPDGTTVIYDVYDENTEDMIFDLQGRRVLETEKGGIYIKGGKKFIAQ